MKLTGKTALVTGASRGIGRVIAQELADAGATVAVHYNRSAEAAETTLANLAGTGHFTIQAEIGDAAQVATMIDSVVERLGKLDILVNNAGVFLAHPATEVDYDTWQAKWLQIIQTNLLGAANAAYCAAKYMKQQGEGRIINVGSRGAYRGEPNAPAYGASKAGMHAMGQSLAQHLAPHGIYVTTVAPGFVQTEMARESLKGASGEAIRAQSPFNRVATAQEIAHVVRFLAEPGAEWLSGGVIDANGASYLR